MHVVVLLLDIAVGGLRAPHTPLGAACDAALADAQREFEQSSNQVRFHVREHTVVGEYSWSDMCGVWGEYSVTLAPDHRAAHEWQAHGNQSSSVWTRRARGWRAELRLRGDDVATWPATSFVDAFRAAVDVCLAAR
jgi:hypothetical protein